MRFGPYSGTLLSAATTHTAINGVSTRGKSAFNSGFPSGVPIPSHRTEPYMVSLLEGNVLSTVVSHQWYNTFPGQNLYTLRDVHAGQSIPRAACSLVPLFCATVPEGVYVGAALPIDDGLTQLAHWSGEYSVYVVED